MVTDDSVLTYYDSLSRESTRLLFDRRRKSPYCNYLHRSLPEGQSAVYLTAIDEKEKIQAAFDALCAQGVAENYKLVRSESDEFPGLSLLRVYNKNAEKRKCWKS